eukprot:Sro21_g015060.1 flavin-containing monooxygenase (707) ;mRNA; r:179830-181950
MDDDDDDKSEDVSALEEQLKELPRIMCFEKAAAPGGVWRSTKSNANATSDSTTTDSTTSSGGNQQYKTDTNMYEALWCNGPKEVMEFHDYTFQEHFGKDQKLPIYLPRQAVLDYLLTRVTRHCPDFFQTYATFHTNVDTVTYDNQTNLFTVQTTHRLTNATITETFDKVIWSAGQNGSGKIPAPIQDKFTQAAQTQLHANANNTNIPPFLHASQLEQRVATQIQDKHLLLIGGSYSAEDLAFMGIKWGASHVTVLTRRHGIDVPVCWTTNWPHDKVSVVAGYTISKVEIVTSSTHNEENDKDVSSSYTLTLSKYAYENEIAIVHDETTTTSTSSDEKPTTKDKTNDDKESTPKPPSPKSVVVMDHDTTTTDNQNTKVLIGIDVVICCTGYSEHLDMLDKSCYNMSDQEYDQYWNGKDEFVLPDNWTMPHNQMSDFIWKYHDFDDNNKHTTQEKEGDEKKSDGNNHGKEQRHSNKPCDIPTAATLYPGVYVNPYSYRELLFVHNPNLMWLAANNFDTPLLALDVQACLALRFITGETPTPSRQEMKDDNYQQALHEMSLPLVRCWMDTEYNHAVQKWLSATTRKVYFTDDNGNACSRYDYPEEWREAYRQTSELELRLLARLMQDADYPLQLGSFDQLNEMGQTFMAINWGCRNYQTCSKTGTTFRDVSAEHCANIHSVFTGAKPVPLKGRWLDMDDLMENVSGMVE